jgi:putative redox protein
MSQPQADGAATPAPAPRAPSRILVTWAGDQAFDAGREGGPTLRFDGTGLSGQTPPDGLLSALAGCTAIDIVEILKKRRTPPTSFRIDVAGTRAETTPRRFTHILLTYHLDGETLERVHAERAIDLSITKYCSVRDSLARDLTIEWTLVLNGTATGERRPG